MTEQHKLKLVRDNANSPKLDEWEKRFIRDLGNKPYSQLSKYQKGIVARLYGWIQNDKP